ncbi:hypothetical protein ACIQG8_21455, partial [Pseudarthrobacter oxydans]|uniref:hypothetical protein n=1 Tax=Pseudarthrobacter oxydans TaxID=1671 RepID=UPI0037FA6840
MGSVRTSILEDLDVYPRTSRRPSTTPSTAKSLLRPGGEIEETDEGLGWDYALVSFSDSMGVKWTRLSRDGELYKQPGRPPWRALVFQTLAQLPILTWLLARWPEKYIMWRFKRRDAVPFSARIYRWLWGYMPIGEPEAWEMPQGAKAQDWPYVYMLSAGRLYRNTGRRALNWYAVIFGLAAVAALLIMPGD